MCALLCENCRQLIAIEEFIYIQDNKSVYNENFYLLLNSYNLLRSEDPMQIENENNIFINCAYSKSYCNKCKNFIGKSYFSFHKLDFESNVVIVIPKQNLQYYN